MPTTSDSDTLAAPRSQTSAAYARLRADILACRFAPEEKLKIAELAEAVAVSPGAIREALSRLVAEQLVVSRDQRGFVVAPLSIADIEDLTDLRCEIEAIVLRRSVERGGVEWEASLIAAAHRLRGTTRLMRGTAHSLDPSWVDRHAAFHAALGSACGSKRLIALHGSLYEQSERFRGLSRLSRPAVRDVEGEHDALLDAALKRDTELLIRLSVEHFRRTTAFIVDAARKGVRSTSKSSVRLRTKAK